MIVLGQGGQPLQYTGQIAIVLTNAANTELIAAKAGHYHVIREIWFPLIGFFEGDIKTGSTILGELSLGDSATIRKTYHLTGLSFRGERGTAIKLLNTIAATRANNIRIGYETYKISYEGSDS